LSSLKHLEFELGNIELQLSSDSAFYRLEVHVFFKDKTIYCIVSTHINVFCKDKSIYFICASCIFAPGREFYHQVEQTQ